MMGHEETPYDPVDQTDVSKDGLNVGAVVADIHAQGYAVVDNFLTPERVESIRTAFNTEVLITEMRAIGTATGRTWRAHNLLAKTRAADPVILDQRLRAIVDGVIGKYSQINIVTLFNTLPGETKQTLHQDDGLWPIPRPHPSFLCNVLIALDDFTEQNGATHIVPCSHGWAHPVDQQAHSLQIELQSGSALFWDGGLWHGGGANTTTDQERMGLFISHLVSYLRPSDLQLLSVPRETVRQLPQKLQRLLGYYPFGNGVDGRDPLDALHDGVVVHPDARLAAHWRGGDGR
ncbi:MAG: phytanoyl-CoA dioxygenase family protein [Pseudomonadales bacterium]|nr:phytanoyl-CoA dioxygenase family protein [Pseudomonadales bacterium]